MPLIPGKSKKAFSKNVETEMDHGKPQAQSLAIAYDMKRRSKKKKMAEGGAVNESAKSEHRPMPEERDHDSKMVGQNSSRKNNAESGWTDQPTVKQAGKLSITPLSRPGMANGLYKVRDRADVVKEEMMMDKMPPSSDKDQPDTEYDEMGAKRQGPKSRDLSLKMMAKGGKVEMEPKDDSLELHEREDEAHMQSQLDPSEDEGTEMADMHDEVGQNRQGDEVPDMEREHSNGRKPYAKGGMALEMDDQPEPEAEEEHHDSIAAAIMAKRDRLHAAIDSGAHDMDEAVRMASGGTVQSGSKDMNYAEGGMDSNDDEEDESSDAYSRGDSRKTTDTYHYGDQRGLTLEEMKDPNRERFAIGGQIDLSRNADEDANEEDQLSYNALRKENYNESEGLAELDSPMDSNEHGDDREDATEDKHDMVSRIRSKMNVRRQFSK